MAGFHANEAMINEIGSANQWAFYQAKSLKSAVLDTRLELLKALGKPTDPSVEGKMAVYEKEQKEIWAEAEHRQLKAESHLHQHVILARGVTMFQISIAVAAISALTKRRRFWIFGLAFGIVGVAFLIQGLLPYHGQLFSALNPLGWFRRFCRLGRLHGFGDGLTCGDGGILTGDSAFGITLD